METKSKWKMEKCLIQYWMFQCFKAGFEMGRAARSGVNFFIRETCNHGDCLEFITALKLTIGTCEAGAMNPRVSNS